MSGFKSGSSGLPAGEKWQRVHAFLPRKEIKRSGSVSLSPYFSSDAKTGLKQLPSARYSFLFTETLSSRPDCSHFLLYRQFLSISGSVNDIPTERAGTVEKDVADRTWSDRRILPLRIVFLFPIRIFGGAYRLSPSRTASSQRSGIQLEPASCNA